MEKRNFINYKMISIKFILLISILLNIFSFPFYNLQSAQLNNDKFFLVHQYGIDICDKNRIQFVRNVMVFSESEQITIDKMANIKIKKFEDGYLICLINEKIYIFDEQGNFLYKSNNINFDIIVNNYSLTIKDKYHYFIGLTSNEGLYLYYYEYNKSTNISDYIAESGEFKIVAKDLAFFKYYYNFQGNGLECHIMFDVIKGETLACFFILYYDGKSYWHLEFFQVEDRKISNLKDYYLQSSDLIYEVKYFKVDVDSNKTNALICGILSDGPNICFNFNSSQNKLLNSYSYPPNPECLMKYYRFKVNYFPEKNEFLFSCVGKNNNLIYIIYILNNTRELPYQCFEDSEKECEKFNGYDFFYSQENHEYYYFSDYTCNKSIDIVDSTIIVEEEFICKLKKCSECNILSSSKDLCIKCNELNGYYPLKKSDNEPLNENNNYIDCFNNLNKPTNFFFNSSMKYYEPCYEACEKCEYGGDKINNNCILCEFGYISIEGINNTFNCIMKCPYYFYYTKFGQYKCSKLTVCPEDYYLLIREKNQCIEDCSKDEEYKYQYNGECFRDCPDNSTNINNDYICLDKNINICSLSKREILVKNEIITEEEIEKLAKSYVKEFVYTDNHLSLYTYNNYEIALYKNSQCISELSLEIPTVSIGGCYEKIKEKNVIVDNLIFAIISQRIKDINYPIIVSFSVYSPYKGNKLNISDICQNDELNVQEDISMKIEDKNKYYFVEYLTKQI